MYVKASTKFSLNLWLCWAMVTVGNGGNQEIHQRLFVPFDSWGGRFGFVLSRMKCSSEDPANEGCRPWIDTQPWRSPVDSEEVLVWSSWCLNLLLLSPQVLNKPMNSCDENTKELSENRFASAQNKTRSLLSQPQSQTAQVKTQFFLQVLQNCTPKNVLTICSCVF